MPGQNSNGVNPLIDADYIKRQLGHRGPKDFFGQNFLVDGEVLSSIVQAAAISKNDTILEVGPGLGVLTWELVQKAGKVIAVEKDKSLVPILKSNLKEFKNLTILNEDILSFHLEKSISGPYKVVANIPYYLSSHLFRYLLDLKLKPELIVLMVQKEVGERIVATPGELSILGISVQMKADVKIARYVSKQSFWPIPKVDSAIIIIKPKNKYPQIKDEKLFFRIVKAAFSGKRKQIHNTLAAGFTLNKEETQKLLLKIGIDPKTRPQDLSIEEWIALYRKLKAAF